MLLETLGRLRRYFLTGGVAAVVDAGLFALLMNFGMGIVTAAASSFIAAAVVNFVLTARFVFNRAMTWRVFGIFFAAAVLGLSINVAVTAMTAWTLGLKPELAKIVGIGSAFLVNFLLNQFVVFRR